MTIHSNSDWAKVEQRARRAERKTVSLKSFCHALAQRDSVTPGAIYDRIYDGKLKIRLLRKNSRVVLVYVPQDFPAK